MLMEKKDWNWLIGKVEKHLFVWCNHFLSQGGRLILVKYVLETIPAYWMSLAFIPKGVLQNIGQLSFRIF